MPSKSSPRFEVDIRQSDPRDSPVPFAGNPLPMWIYDIETLRFLEVNESAERQYGYTREEFLSMTLNDIAPQEFSNGSEVCHAGSPGPDGAWIHCKRDGTQIHVKVRANELRFRGRDAKFVVAEDITERRHVHAQLLQMVHHDALTGLPNRILLEQRMNQAFAAARKGVSV